MESALKPRIICVVNHKGGVAKTTIAAQIAYGLARQGLCTLAIDMDPQANLSLTLGSMQWKGDSTEGTIYRVLDKRDVAYTEALQPKLSIIPADIFLAEAEMGFINRQDWQFLLKRALAGLLNGTRDDVPHFEYIIIDCPPNLGLLTTNALMASQEVIVPMTCDAYSFYGLPSVMRAIDTVATINTGLKLSGVVATRFNKQRNIDKDSLAKMQEMFADTLFRSRIPENTSLKEAGGLSKSIWDYSPGSLAATALAELVEEIIERGPREQAG